MILDLTVDEVLTTTRSVRRRLDLNRPVPRDELLTCLELALQAPTAADTQGWHWLFVEDPAQKSALADIYRGNLGEYQHTSLPQSAQDGASAERVARLAASGQHLVAHLDQVPVLLIPCLRGRVDDAQPGLVATFWASLMPAVWSFCLALRSRGMGSCWTTMHLLADGERKAAEVLGIPHEGYSQAGMLPIAYTKGTDFKPAPRIPAGQVAHFDRW